jgi:hypothetical protein
MPDEKLFDELINRERAMFSLLLATKAQRAVLTLSEYIQLRVMQGTDLNIVRDELFTDLQEGGRIFGELRRAIKATVRGSVNRVRDDAYFSQLGIDKKYRWSAVLVKTCPDCLKRHGQVKTWAEWEAKGLPRTGQTVCRENCHCVLIPDEFAELEPVRRTPRT